jgi:hypothetical protein
MSKVQDLIGLLTRNPNGLTKFEISDALFGFHSDMKIANLVREARLTTNTEHTKLISMHDGERWVYKRTRNKEEIRKWQQRYARDTSTKSDMLERNVHTEELKTIATDLLAVAEKLVRALA